MSYGSKSNCLSLGLLGQLALSNGPTLLGEGAFGKVYKKTRRVTNMSQVCAVKKIRNFDQAAVNEVETLMHSTTSITIVSSSATAIIWRTKGKRSASSWSMQTREPEKMFTEEAQRPGSVYWEEWAIWRVMWSLSSALD